MLRVLCVLAVAVFGALPASAEKRVALIIGNSAYQSAPPLPNTKNDAADMAELWGVPGGPASATNQVLYNLQRRGIERNLLPWCAGRNVAIMAYSPLDQGRLRIADALRDVGRRHAATPAQVALAWTMRHDHVVTIPKASRRDHVRDNARAADIVLTEEDLAELDRAYPVPKRDVPLETA